MKVSRYGGASACSGVSSVSLSRSPKPKFLLPFVFLGGLLSRWARWGQQKPALYCGQRRPLRLPEVRFVFVPESLEWEQPTHPTFYSHFNSTGAIVSPLSLVVSSSTSLGRAGCADSLLLGAITASGRNVFFVLDGLTCPCCCS